MNKTKLYWLSQIGGWSLYFISEVFFFALSNSFVAEEMILTMFFSRLIVLSMCIFTSHWYRYFIVRWNWLSHFTVQLIPKVILMSLLLGSLTYCYMTLSSIFLGDFNTERDFSAIIIVINVFGYSLLYFFWTTLYFMFHYVESYNKSLKYDAAIGEIRLNKLKSQLNPHFIFNGLNSIRALVDEDPAKSKQAITQLSNILRNSLAMDEQKLVRFSEEMRTVKDYLDLESIRFEERIKFDLRIDPDSDMFLIPPMMIQTLVENGIKHGISNLVNGGIILIDTQVKKDFLIIRIRNSGQYLNGHQNERSGYGLENTKQRLELIYGSRASFSIKNEDDSTVLTELKVPKMKINV